ncbi:hypothetical protein JQ628_11435 [Bradyrhizobium lablabi]|uniref:GcrA family cell cycle regulator n=1 Tax=Bradyrhizobium lablabi TaxID=722472 RepID=UPI001BAA5A31|nr:GcrA family cell cycle regulator [Bradyrhizobium lablabi]MBR1122128.1 hypothetical protein [Bradyrhizobium lablabi]
MGIDFWTDERIATLKRLWAEGESSTDIAAKLRCTRNSVLGKLYRLREPQPMVKKRGGPRNRVYTRQPAEITRANARLRQDRYRAKRKQSLSTKRGVRAMFLASGASRTSAEYRKHLPLMPEMTKGELRAMLAQAVQNTARLS